MRGSRYGAVQARAGSLHRQFSNVTLCGPRYSGGEAILESKSLLCNYPISAELSGNSLELTSTVSSISKNVPALIFVGSDLAPTLAFQLKTIFISLIPLCLNAVLFAVTPANAVSGMAWIWLLYFGGIVFYLLQSMRFLFSRAISTMPSLDALLPEREDRQFLVRILITTGRRSLQLGASLSSAAAFMVALWFIAPALTHRLSIGPASYVAVGLVIFCIINGGYWIIASVVLLRAFHLRNSVAVRRLDPLRTPALLELNRFYAVAAAFTTAVFLIMEAPALLVLVLAHRSPLVVALNILAPLVALSFVIPITILPRAYLSRVITKEKGRTLEIIATGRADMGTCGAAELKSIVKKLSIPERMQLYSLTSQMPETTYTKGARLQLSLGIATIIVPYVAQAIKYFTH